MLIYISAGCGKRPPVEQIAARVGDSVIVPEDLQEAYQLPARTSDSASVRAWEEAARDWAIREILLQEADKLGLEQDSLFKARMSSLHDEILLQRLYERVAVANEVDSAEILEEYNRRLSEFVAPSDQVDLIYVRAPTRSEADEARRALQGGEDLSVLLSRLQSLQGQALGWVGFSDLNPEIAKAAFTLLPGAISYPLKYEMGGYIVLQCRQRRPQGTILPLAEVYDQIRDRLEIRNQADAEWTLRDSLWGAYKPIINIK